MKKHLLTAAAALLLLGTALASCGETASDPVNAENPGNDTAAETAAVTETDVYDLVETPDLGGYTFRICNNTSNFAYQVIDLDEATGEPLDDSIYRRNTEVEKALNITITAQDMAYNEVITTLKNSVMAGDNAYDVYFDEIGQFLGNGIFNTYLTDMQSVSTIHYENPWWNVSAMDSIQIDKRRFFLFNDIDVMFYECFGAFLYNKTMAASYDMPDFYSLVDQGKWTLDVVKENMLAASSDLNGDGKFDSNDQYGCACFASCMPGFFVAANTHFITKDADGKPVWGGLTERMTDVYNKICDCLFSNKDAIRTPGSPNLAELDQHGIFHGGKSLFYFEPLGSAKKMRDVDFEVGVLPFPKYDEAQENYGSYICNIAAACVVPITCNDAEKMGSILEVMAAYSNKYVRPAYFDTTLNFKYAQDETSQKMLDIILTGGEFELGTVYNWGNLGTQLTSLIQSPSDKWASTFEKINDKVKAAIEKTINSET